MYKLLFLISFANVVCYKKNYDVFSNHGYHRLSRRDDDTGFVVHPNYNTTYYPPLRNYHINATKVKEEDYPWAARVIHSTVNPYPHICTAVCVEQRIFITAARCLFRLKVAYTRVYYERIYMPALTFISPTNTTRQMFDDIGLIVVQKVPYVGSWPYLAFHYMGNRTDDQFMWFDALHLELREHYVVGYASVKRFVYPPKTPYDLTRLDKIKVDMRLCNKITRFDETSNDYWVPCYHSCTYEDCHHNGPDCLRHHGVEGGVLLDFDTNKLLAIATWGAYTYLFNLPTGVSVPNSENFWTDYVCARKIRDHSQHGRMSRSDFDYQTLCN